MSEKVIKDRCVITNMEKGQDRKSVTTLTLQKVKEFLKKQKKPLHRYEIRNQIQVNSYSLDLAIQILDAKIDKEGRISWKK